MEDELGPPEAKAAASWGYENAWVVLGLTVEAGVGGQPQGAEQSLRHLQMKDSWASMTRPPWGTGRAAGSFVHAFIKYVFGV